MPNQLRTLTMTETAAKKITSYDVLTVTGLLQTEAYANELFIETGIEPPKDIKTGVGLRVERQAIKRRTELA